MNRQVNKLSTRSIWVFMAIVLPLLIAGCIEKPVGPVTGKSVTISGKVLNSDNKTPIAGALVYLAKPPLRDTTDSNGLFRFSFDADSSYSTTIITIRAGFAPDTLTLFINAGKDISLADVLLKVITIGLPAQSHFTMSVEKKNFPGLVALDATNTVRVRVGDKFGNPVEPGTRINFTSRGGTIDASSFTDNSGFAQAKLYGGNPQPFDPGRGFAWVKASALGEGGTTVRDSLVVLFSGSTQISGPVSGFTLRDGGTQAFEYTVADENGNPLTGGTTISISLTGSTDVRLDGDISVLLPDTQDKTKYTRFSFTLTDTKPLDTAGDKDLGLTISVSSANGDKTYTFTGKLLAADVSGGGRSGAAATIALVQLTKNAISVRGVGAEETSTVTFEVRDSLGRPVDQAHQVTVSFVLFFNGHTPPGADIEYVAPVTAQSDPQTGRVQTTVNSGTRAGVVQIVAQTQTIRSAPVIIDIFGGFPVDSLFYMKSDKPQYTSDETKARITVQAGDRYSNPVKPGTAIYFSSTNGGVITASAYTDKDGFAFADLYLWNSGIYAVTARTLGEHNEPVDETIYLERAKPPSGGGSGSAATIALVGLTRNAISVREVGGEETSIVTFEVRDSLGRPVDQAHQVTVSFGFQQNPPGGGEFLSPLSALTGELTGRVQTTVNSGTKAGVVQVVAQAIVGSRTIRSAPVTIDIYGGFPVLSHFSIGAERLNFPGYNILGLTDKITVLAGDKYGNPVKPGTTVYFSTTGGVITASGYTDAKGGATAELISGNPRPIDPIRGAGFARVSATTVGQFSETVTDTMYVLFSGVPSIKNVNPTTFSVPAGGASGPINFEVSDQNGNPLSGGTTITVTLQYTPPPNTTINLSVTGDINVTLGDTQARGLGTTQFSFQVVDQTVGGVGATIPVTVVISVKSPNGNPPNATLTGTVG